MTRKELAEKLDKLVKDVQSMEQTPTIARTLQGIEHAVFCLNPNEPEPQPEPEITTGLSA